MRLWQRLDGCADNSMAIDVVDANMETVIAGSCVRDAGWRASAASVCERDRYGWPPSEQLLPITLRRSHWRWALSQLERWEPYADDGATAHADLRALIDDALRDA
ncbi:hypothetical protein L2X99_08915 [Microbacterium sp. KUDC0406]|uniref:hypothetical protein n=1 Tax=Microbacterium sp. KUDC0406 TaxID=2909588 RepID=UPI001F455419|nr:hypothetical protein [Microbacterium sp. KUDC0406]UJP11579.1 hypothetical protein L2X99_08915 [Microbacterium sp. KUDC0406]